MTMSHMEKLAKEARCIPDGKGGDDWGSERQINAENTFTNAVKRRVSKDAWEQYESYCHKANVDEMIDEGLRIVEKETFT